MTVTLKNERLGIKVCVECEIYFGYHDNAWNHNQKTKHKISTFSFSVD